MAKFIAPIQLMNSPAFQPFAMAAALSDNDRGQLLPDGRMQVESHNLSLLQGAHIQAFINAGGAVEDAPVFVKMSPATYSSAVPVGISNREATVDDVTTIRNWDAWHSPNHSHMVADDGEAIVPGNSWGSEISSNELSVLITDGNYTILLGHELAAILPAETIE